MRRRLAALTALPALCLLAAADAPPPHAWLFGTWTGGLFPAPPRPDARSCAGQPAVIFTRDVVMRATLTSPLLIERQVETARTAPDGAEIRLVAPPPAASDLLGGASPVLPGFGCESPNVLHVHRLSENQITFPGCADFPEPLVRCPG